MDGFLVPALGAVPIRTSTATPALLRGYAVVTTNSGHPEPTTEFGLDQQARLDYLDGLKDGIINAWETCKFDPKSLKLAKQKIEAIEKIFNGAKNSKGEQIYSGWFYDSGVSAEGWRQWKLGDSQSAKPNARNITLSSGSVNYYFLTPAQPNFDTINFDFDKDTPKTFETAAVNDAISTSLSTFSANGGKLIIVTGVSDPVFSAKDQRDWFKKLEADNENSQNFVAFFALPGLNHCGGGNGIDDVDPLGALEAWHEKGEAPKSMLAKSKTYAGKEFLVCAYPKVATYVGADASKASSFVCK